MDTTDPGMMPIRIIDAAAMLRRQVSNNERPYTQAMLRNNNKIVDEWYEQVLKKIANKNGEIRAGQVWGEWQFYYHGRIIPQFIAAMDQGVVSRPDPKAVDHWVKVFAEKSIEELAEMGPAVVGHGWKLVSDEAFIRGAIDKWEQVYSKSDDPLKWRKLSHDNPKLWAAEHQTVFWGPEQYQDITQKVVTVLKISVSPQ